MVQDFGVLLSIGIVALLIAGIVVPITLIGARERRSPTTKEPVEGWVEATVDRLGSLPRVAVLPLVLVGDRVADRSVCVLEIGFEDRERSDQLGQPVEHVDQERATRSRTKPVSRRRSASSSRPRARRPTACSPTRWARSCSTSSTNRSAENPELAGASSLATTVGWLAEVPGTTSLPPTGLDMLQAYNIAPAAAAGPAGRRQRQRRAGAVPGRPVVARTTRGRARQRAIGDRRSGRRRTAAGTGVGDHRRARRRRRRTAREHHREPRATDDRRACCSSARSSCCAIATSPAVC